MKIWGNVVGNVSPNANWGQEDPAKADYVSGKDTVDAAIKNAQESATKERYKQTQAVLAADGWSDMKQSVFLDDVKKDTLLIVDFAKESKLDASYYGVAADYQEDGEIIFVCEAVPDRDIAAQIAVFY